MKSDLYFPLSKIDKIDYWSRIEVDGNDYSYVLNF